MKICNEPKINPPDFLQWSHVTEESQSMVAILIALNGGRNVTWRLVEAHAHCDSGNEGGFGRQPITESDVGSDLQLLFSEDRGEYTKVQMACLGFF